jgi:uncharacterized membrane protein YkoI
MKRVLATAAVVGLVAVPSIAFASHGADDINVPAGDVRQEDRQANRQEDKADKVPAGTAQARDDQAVSPSNTAITEAITIAQNEMPGKTVVKVEHENEDGVDVFSVRFDDGSRVDVDSSTGAVVRNENGDESDQDDSNSGRNHAEDASNGSHSGRH